MKWEFAFDLRLSEFQKVVRTEPQTQFLGWLESHFYETNSHQFSGWVPLVKEFSNTNYRLVEAHCFTYRSKNLHYSLIQKKQSSPQIPLFC